MKKVLLNKNGLRSVGAVLVFCLMAVCSFGQAVGDIGSNPTTLTGGVYLYSDKTNWITCTSAGTWAGATTPSAAAPGSTTNVIVRAGHTITMNATGNCKNLTVESTATLVSNVVIPTGSPTTMRLNGTAVQLDGTVGGSTTALAFEPNITSEITISGSGTIILSRIRPNIAGSTTTIASGCSISTNYAGSAGAGGTSITANGKDNTIFNINGTLTTATLSGIGLGSGNAAPAALGGLNFTIAVKGTINIGNTAYIALRNNTGASSNAYSTLNIDGGTVNYGTSALLYSDNFSITNVISGTNTFAPASTTLNGKLRIKPSNYFPTNITMGVSPALIEYYGTSALTLPASPTTYPNLAVNNSGGLSLSAAATVTGTLTLTSGNITLGVYDLTVGSTSSGSTSSHVVTDGAGALKRTAITAGAFPVGPDATHYNPITVANSAANDFSVRVATGTGTPSGLPQSAYAIDRTWNITSASTSADITFGYNDLDANGSCTPTSAMTLAHHNGTAWVSNGTGTPAAGSGTDRQVTFTGITSFSPFIVGNAAVLSAELTSFKAKSNGNTNNLTWTTATEKNNMHFNIERSANGSNFTSIGTVKGSGTTTSANNYTFTDETPLSISYYRLQSVDFDGKIQASNVVTVFRSASGKLKVYPTLASDKLTIVLDNTDTQTFSISDLMGRSVQTGQLNG